MEINELTIKDFTFAIIGQDIEHMSTPIDGKVGYIGYFDVALYIDKRTRGGQKKLQDALKLDMELAFNEFIGFYTSIEHPNSELLGFDTVTIPNPITIFSPSGFNKEIYYLHGEIYDNFTNEIFDCSEYRDQRRQELGLPPLKELTFEEYQKSSAHEKREIFRALQKEYIRKASLFSYAIDLINLSEVKVGKTPQQDVTRICKEDQSLDNLTPFLKGTSGKKAALIVSAAMRMGILTFKPSFSELKKRGAIGSPDGYNRYFRINSNYILLDNEIESTIKSIKAQRTSPSSEK